jgi:hypothetical protein
LYTIYVEAKPPLFLSDKTLLSSHINDNSLSL